MAQVIIIDYGMANLNSVKRKFVKIGVNATISSAPQQITTADRLVLPGVGHFKRAVFNLKDSRIWDALNEAVLVRKVPILGICLGMQLMARHSEEGDVDGLGWFNADVVRFKATDRLKYKIPHMGWNTVRVCKDSTLFKGVLEHSEFYFVHSYHYHGQDPSEILSYTTYEYEFCSAVEKGNIFGVQYHPEKSHEVGEKILRNFAEL
jgi:imidazole glycerol-phosphate synthase subunit HisH